MFNFDETEQKGKDKSENHVRSDFDQKVNFNLDTWVHSWSHFNEMQLINPTLHW